MLHAQEPMTRDMKRGQFRRLCPRVREEEIIVVEQEAEQDEYDATDATASPRKA